MTYNDKLISDKNYFALTYLASYWRWCSFRSPHVGSRSPINGMQYTHMDTQAHATPHLAASKAMAREYLKLARAHRLGARVWMRDNTFVD